MNRRKRSKVMAAVLTGALMMLGVVHAQPKLDLALCLDSSGSVSNSEFQLQLDGTAAAVADPAVMPQDGSVRLTIIQFGRDVYVELPPTEVTAANVASLTSQIRNIVKGGGTTNMAGCINEAANQITSAVPASARQIIDLSTDGVPDNAAATTTASRNAQAAGIDVLNALGVGAGVEIAYLETIVFPQPAGGNDGFVVVTADFTAYAQEIARKIRIETQTNAGVVQAIPTLGEWAMLLLGASLMLAGGIFMRRRISY
ncbi:IPTL-CTERM sorting domain-containing protein [Thiolapillus sp.]